MSGATAVADKFVYFIKPIGHVGPIKIGCTRCAQMRLKHLMNSSPWPLEILAVVPGSFELESKLHRSLAYAHLRKEWFEPVAEIMAGIDALKRGISVDVAFDLTKKTGWLYKPANFGTRKSDQHREWQSYISRLRYVQNKLPRCADPDGLMHEGFYILRSDRREIPLTENEKARVEEIILTLKAAAQAKQIVTISGDRS